MNSTSTAQDLSRPGHPGFGARELLPAGATRLFNTAEASRPRPALEIAMPKPTTLRPFDSAPEKPAPSPESSSEPLPTLYLLVVDDDAAVRSACAEIGRRMGFLVLEASNANQARLALKGQKIDVLLTDPRNGGINPGDSGSNGVALLEMAKSQNPEVSVVVMTATTTVSTAIEAMRMGAEDLLPKPFDMEELMRVLERAAQRTQVHSESRRTRERLRSQRGTGPLVSKSPEMEKLYRILSKVAHSTHPVIILGESGTGKELVARSIHFNGPNATKQFLAVDCASLAPALMEGYLFGYVKEADGGAVSVIKDGLLASAEGGTIFLDEVSELAPEIQSRLARTLQERVVRSVGGTRSLPLAGRILAASNRDLAALVEQGKFRKDLYFRLNVVSLRIPPLRDRKEDVGVLAQLFLDRINRATGSNHSFTEEALRALALHHWPGNVQELESMVDRVCAMSSGPILHLADLPTQFTDLCRPPAPVPAEITGVGGALHSIIPIATMEKQAILTTIHQLKGDKLLAAKLLGIGKTTLYRKLKEYELSEAC